VLYGFSSDLLKHMALKTVQSDSETRFALEDVFVAGDDEKLAWVNGWRRLPHISRDVEKQFEYPQQFAEDVFNRLEAALRTRVAGADVPVGRVHVAAADDGGGESAAPSDLPIRYIESSDRDVIAAHKAEPCDEAQLLADRGEGKFLVSYQTSGGWVAIRKSVLSEVLGAGRDVTLTGLPSESVDVLTLMCPGLVAPGRAAR
jgi:hypothetical protein